MRGMPKSVEDACVEIADRLPRATKAEWGVELRKAIAEMDDPRADAWADHAETMKVYAATVAAVVAARAPRVLLRGEDGKVISDSRAVMSDGRGEQLLLWREMLVPDFLRAVAAEHSVALGRLQAMDYRIKVADQLREHEEKIAKLTVAKACKRLGIDLGDLGEAAA